MVCQDGVLILFVAVWGDALHAAGRIASVGSLEPVEVVRGSYDSKLLYRHNFFDGVVDFNSVETGHDFFESPNGKSFTIETLTAAAALTKTIIDSSEHVYNCKNIVVNLMSFQLNSTYDTVGELVRP